MDAAVNGLLTCPKYFHLSWAWERGCEFTVDISSQITCETSKQPLFLRFSESGRWISEVSFSILAMVLCYCSLGTRQSSRTLFPLFAAKTLFRFFDGFFEFSNKVAIPESKCLFCNRDGRATRTAQQHSNSLLGTINNSLVGTQIVFPGATSNCLL